MEVEDATSLGFAETVARIRDLAAMSCGTVTGEQVEQDERLARDRRLTCAAGRQLASGTRVSAIAAKEGWFPYASLSFTGTDEG